MEENKAKDNSSNSDNEESLKNEDYLLGFDSKYKTELYKEEELEKKNKEKKDDKGEPNIKISLDSTSISVLKEKGIYQEMTYMIIKMNSLIFMTNKEKCLHLYVII